MKPRTTLIKATALCGVMVLSIPAFAAGAGGAGAGSAAGGPAGASTGSASAGAAAAGAAAPVTGVNESNSGVYGNTSTADNGSLTGSGSSASQMDANAQNNQNAAVARTTASPAYPGGTSAAPTTP